MGETWIFSLANGQPANAHAAPPGSKPGPNELMVSLKPQIGSTMIVTNNTDRFLNYRATIIAPNGERPTSVCTLMSGGRAGFENWHGNIAAIRLSDFSPAEDNKMVCQ
jgi:hypothetical protein